MLMLLSDAVLSAGHADKKQRPEQPVPDLRWVQAQNPLEQGS